jgi:F-type H+-transporting ATPase subunit delta
MTGNVVARRYAKALVETVAEQAGDLEAVHAELRDLAEVIDGHRDLSSLLYSPSVRLDVKGAIVEDLIEKAGLTDLSSTFVRLLLEKGRLRYLGSIAETFEQMANERLGRLKVSVVSATPLAEAEMERLSAELAEATGKTIVMEAEIDPALIGGLVVKVGGRVVDGSIRHQLDALRESLVRG